MDAVNTYFAALTPLVRDIFLCYTTSMELAKLENPLLPGRRKYSPITPTSLECFIELMRAGYGPTYAARELNLSYDMIRREKKQNKDFAIAFEDARECLIDELEDRLIERAIKGTERPIVQKGERVYERDPKTGDLVLDDSGNPIPVVEHVYPDHIALAVLKANKRHVYGEKIQHDVQVTHGVLRVPELPASEQDWESTLIDIKAEPVEPE